MATIRKLKSSTWQVNWMNPLTGKRERISCKSKKEADILYKEYSLVSKMSKSNFNSEFIKTVTGSENEYTLEKIWDWYENNRASNLNKDTVYHYKRSDIKKHFRQIYRYGFHRGKFFRNLDQNSFKFYYTIPSIFILCHLLYFIKKELFFFMFFIYFILLFIDMIFLLSKEKNFILILLSRIFVYFNHITYGAGFILGFLKKKYKISLYR